ncbi:MAG: hypothetical protein R3C46_04420 [Hyphomonadaceae bacterium]
MQSDNAPRHPLEDVWAVASRQALAFVVSAAAGAMLGGMIGWAVTLAAVALSVVPIGYFRNIWSDRQSRRAIMFGLTQVIVTSLAVSFLGVWTLGYAPTFLGSESAAATMCIYGAFCSAALQSLVAIVALICLALGVELPEFIDE